MTAPSLSEELLRAVKGVYDGLDARLHEVPYCWSEDGMTVAGNFYYPAFRDGQPTIDDFVEYIYFHIIPFCIPRKQRHEKDQKYRETDDPRYMHELTDQARNLFVRARQSQQTTGEPGELILFMLLEAILGAPQVACKMYLKTSEQMPVHGTDSIHVKTGASGDNICLIWGESKIYQDLPSALTEICKSISTFIQDAPIRSRRDRDIDILRDHIDVPNHLREPLLKFFDPYQDESNEREEAFACFVGFEFSAYADLHTLSRNQREAQLVEKYRHRVVAACGGFAQKLRASGLASHAIHFFLIPFPSVDELRRKFFAKLGISP